MGEMDCTTYVVYHINVRVITLHKNYRPQIHLTSTATEPVLALPFTKGCFTPITLISDREFHLTRRQNDTSSGNLQKRIVHSTNLFHILNAQWIDVSQFIVNYHISPNNDNMVVHGVKANNQNQYRKTNLFEFFNDCCRCFEMVSIQIPKTPTVELFL